MTEYSLKPGQTISFTGEAGSVKGVVRWNLPADEAYRVGVEFCWTSRFTFQSNAFPID